MGKVVRKVRRRLKVKRVLLAIILLILIIGSSYYFVRINFFDTKKEVVDTDGAEKIDINLVINNIISYSNNEVDTEFLNWIISNYGEEVLINAVATSNISEVRLRGRKNNAKISYKR